MYYIEWVRERRHFYALLSFIDYSTIASHTLLEIWLWYHLSFIRDTIIELNLNRLNVCIIHEVLKAFIEMFTIQEIFMLLILSLESIYFYSYVTISSDKILKFVTWVIVVEDNGCDIIGTAFSDFMEFLWEF